MNYEDHCIGAGRLWGKLQSLEVTLRIFLTQANPSKNYITSRDTFGTLVEKYNNRLSKDERSLYSAETSVVDIRNALAHGLVSGRTMGFPLTLLHKDLEVEMTVNWFGDQHSLAQEQIDRISACGGTRWQSPWWGR